MIKAFKWRNIINYLIVIFCLNLLITEEKYDTYHISIKKKVDTLGELNIDDMTIEKEKIKDDSKVCLQWVPSLFNPINLVPSDKDIDAMNMISYKDNIPKFINRIISEKELSLKYFTSTQFKIYELIYAKEKFTKTYDLCYFGLSPGVGNYTLLDYNETNLNRLEKKNEISDKIFSFDKWDLNDVNSINISFYFGDQHENFTSNNGVIGTCNTSQEDSFWGCSFKEMSFNNSKTSLINQENEFYKIYFSSENHDIIFPQSFKDEFNKITNYNCKEIENTNEISCINLLKPNDFFPLKLIDDNMIITIEIDNKYRFNKEKDDNQYITNIKFENVDYFIFPLIVFKKFHVQFNDKNNIISFYTTDESILELKKNNDNKEEEKEGEQESSNVGTVLLVNFSVLIILALGIGILWFLKKRKNSSKNNIDKYNKFEDEENFQNLDEKRVF